MIKYQDIPGFPGYRAGTDGSIRSCWGKGAQKGGKVVGRRLLDSDHKLKGHVQRHGYIEYALMTPEGKRRSFLGHRLVLLAHVGPCPAGMEGRHLNGNRSHNALSNLRWGTKQENIEDQRRHGTLNIGSRNGSAKLTAADVHAIRKLRARGIQPKDLAQRFGVKGCTIANIVARRIWRHLT